MGIAFSAIIRPSPIGAVNTFVNLSGALAYTHPEWVRDVHREFFAVGCDAVETNTFNGSKLVLTESASATRLTRSTE